MLGVALAVPLFLLVVVDMGAERMRLGAVAVAMGFCITVGAPFGMLIATLLSRELEGTLLLLAVVGIQMTIDPVSVASRLTPLWSSRELAFFAIDHTDSRLQVRGPSRHVALTG